jgi:hypothetical protein
MPSWIIALLVGLAVTAWSYTKLAHANGNPDPKANFLGACLAGFVMFVFIFSLLKLVFDF